MHHQTLQSDFQPPYFPPPFHHTTQSPPQQQVGSTGDGSIILVLSMYVNVYFICFAPSQNHGLDYLSTDPYGQPLSSLHHAPLHHYNQLAGLRPSQEQLGLHRSHRESELQQHVVSGVNIPPLYLLLWSQSSSHRIKTSNWGQHTSRHNPITHSGTVAAALSVSIEQ